MCACDLEENLHGEERQPDVECASSREAIFSVHNLSFAYQHGKKQLDNVSFALHPGQSIGLMGANGAGKTTFLRCITGLCKPEAGEIRLGSKVLQGEKDFFDLRRNVGYALQNADDQLFFPTVLEDLAFGPLNLGLSPAQARERAMESLALVGLEGYENRLNHQLSGGEKRLLALASILAMRPRALLLDEPLNGLDESARERVGKLISSLDCAKLIVAHDLDFLDSICDSRLILRNGHLHPVERYREDRSGSIGAIGKISD